MDFVSEEERKRRIQSLLQGIAEWANVPLVVQSETPEEKDLSQDGFRYLNSIDERPCDTKTEHRIKLDWHPMRFSRASEELLGKGCIRYHKIPRATGRGAQFQVPEILEHGSKELEKRSITPRPRLLKGGALHSIYGWKVIQVIKQKNHQYSVERTLGQKIFDIVEEDNGMLLGHEIICSGSVNWNLSQTKKAEAVDGVTFIVCWFDSKTALDALKKELEKVEILAGKIQCRLVTELFKVE